MPFFVPAPLTDEQVGSIFVQSSLGRDLGMETRGSTRAIWLATGSLKTTSVEAVISLSAPPERPTATLTWRLRFSGWLMIVGTLVFAIFAGTQGLNTKSGTSIPFALGVAFVWLATMVVLLVSERDRLATRLGLMA